MRHIQSEGRISHKDIARTVTIAAVLERFGHRTDCRQNPSGTHRMYYNPWNQNEKDPSMSVKRLQDGSEVFCLFSPTYSCAWSPVHPRTGKARRPEPSGDVVTLYELLAFGHDGVREEYGKALEALAPLAGYSPAESVSQPMARNREDYDNSREFTYIGPLKDEKLLDYASSRCIPEAIAKAVYMQADYKVAVKRGGKMTCRALAHPNFQGFDLRNSNPHSKMCTGSDITVRYADGILARGLMDRSEKRWANDDPSMTDITPHASSVVVVEGAFDEASVYAWPYAESIARGLTVPFRMPAESDVVCLNSTSNTVRAIPLLLRYENIILYLDNDAAGRRAAAQIIMARAEDRGARFSFSDLEMDRCCQDVLSVPDTARARKRAEILKGQETTNPLGLLGGAELIMLDEAADKAVERLCLPDYATLGYGALETFANSLDTVNVMQQLRAHGLSEIADSAVCDRCSPCSPFHDDEWSDAMGIKTMSSTVFPESNDLNEALQRRVEGIRQRMANNMILNENKEIKNRI